MFENKESKNTRVQENIAYTLAKRDCVFLFTDSVYNYSQIEKWRYHSLSWIQYVALMLFGAFVLRHLLCHFKC
jgi:hypothetical protein